MNSGALLALLFLLAASISRADVQTIKLTCDLDVTIHHPAGDNTYIHETDDVDMSFDDKTGFKRIAIHSLSMPVVVANTETKLIHHYIDNSDANRWNIFTDRSEPHVKQAVAIDRNTGSLTASVVTTIWDISESRAARGTCNKVDASKQRF